MSRKNTALKLAIFESGMTQREIARKAKLPSSILSLSINGRYNLDQKQKMRISKALKQDSEALFIEK